MSSNDSRIESKMAFSSFLLTIFFIFFFFNIQIRMRLNELMIFIYTSWDSCLNKSMQLTRFRMNAWNQQILKNFGTMRNAILYCCTQSQSDVSGIHVWNDIILFLRFVRCVRWVRIENNIRATYTNSHKQAHTNTTKFTTNDKTNGVHSIAQFRL